MDHRGCPQRQRWFDIHLRGSDELQCKPIFLIKIKISVFDLQSVIAGWLCLSDNYFQDVAREDGGMDAYESC